VLRSLAAHHAAPPLPQAGANRRSLHRYRRLSDRFVADSQPRPVTTSVWLLYYAGSLITKSGQAVIGTWAHPQFWTALRNVRIEALHTTRQVWGAESRERIHADPRRLARPHLYRHRSAVRYRGRVPAGDSSRRGQRGDHRPRSGAPPHRLGRRRPARRAGVQGLTPTCIRWSRSTKRIGKLLPKIDDPWATALVPKDAAVERHA
jgi:hypothetical protein